MRTALIGYTGFVGGNLARQYPFTDLYTSRNIDQIQEQQFDLLVCAGAPGAKWKANLEPEKDRQCIECLARNLETATIRKFILISTVDVYHAPIAVDEATEVNPALTTPYGRHRHELERLVASRFDSLIVRLPGLFGPGLRKNVVYDFLNGNCVDRIHCDSLFQFYCTDWLWEDIEEALGKGLNLVHFATEPVTVREVAGAGFGWDFQQRPVGIPPARYDMRSRNAALYQSAGDYLYSKEQVLAALRQFVSIERKLVA